MDTLKTAAKILILILLSSSVFAQEVDCRISGKITDKSTGKPILYADVFISGTLWGTTTNKAGEYVISSVYPGEHELIVSILGYKTESKVFTIKAGEKIKLDFALATQAVEFNEIEISAESPDRWFDDLRLFKRLFLGKTGFAEDCRILNEKQIEFDHPKDHIMTAKSKEPLKILNGALGFKMSCILMNFKYDHSESRLQYMVKTQFQEMETDSEERKEEWIENRITAYKGSLDHFLYSLVNNNFTQNGFALSSSRVPSREGFNAFREDYWASDSLVTFVNPSEARLYFPNYLQVIYKASDISPRPVSWIRLLFGEAYIDKYGYTRELVAFETSGYWASVGIADMLPKFYFADNDALLK